MSSVEGRAPLPRVSVVVPCYNYGRYLEECVASIVGQEGVQTEVLVIDDCSTDDSLALAHEVAARHPEVEVRHHAVNRGHIATYNEGLLEWVEYVGHRYGTLRSEIDRIHGHGRAPLLDLEIEGALRVRDEVPGAVTVFIDAPLEELERRLRARATESSGQIEERLAIAKEQKRFADAFDNVVVNDRLERAAAELEGLVTGELAAAATIGP